MHPVQYVLRFRGTGQQTSDAPVRMKARATACPARFKTDFGAGLGLEVKDRQGELAHFESIVEFTGDGVFQESGRITFGDAGSIDFETVGEGHVESCVVPGRQQGSVSWRVTGGTESFAGASGMITSNFTLDPDGDLTDYQFGVLYVAEA